MVLIALVEFVEKSATASWSKVSVISSPGNMLALKQFQHRLPGGNRQRLNMIRF